MPIQAKAGGERGYLIIDPRRTIIVLILRQKHRDAWLGWLSCVEFTYSLYLFPANCYYVKDKGELAPL